jgi:hypothetical protein
MWQALAIYRIIANITMKSCCAEETVLTLFLTPHSSLLILSIKEDFINLKRIADDLLGGKHSDP